MHLKIDSKYSRLQNFISESKNGTLTNRGHEEPFLIKMLNPPRRIDIKSGYGMYTAIGYGGQIQRWRYGTFTRSVYGPDPGHCTRLSYTVPYYTELLLVVIVHRFQA